MFVGVGALIITAVSGLANALFFLIFCGLVALALSEAYRRAASLEMTITFSALIPFSVGAVLLLLFGSGGETGFFEGLTHWAKAAIDTMLETYKNVGMEQSYIEWVENNSESMINLFMTTFFSMAFISVVFLVVVNYLVINILSDKLGLGIHFEGHYFSKWRTIDTLVWAVIAGGIATYLFDGFAGAVGLNILIISGLAYLFQGIAIIHFYFAKLGIPVILRAIGYFIVFSQMMLIVAVSMIGFADVWADFRKLDAPNNEQQD